MFYSIYESQGILNALLECTELFNTVKFIFTCTDCSIREYQFDISPAKCAHPLGLKLCWRI